MSRRYVAKWSARTRGARWKTVTGEETIVGSSAHIAASRALKTAERLAGAKIGAITLHLEDLGPIAPKRKITQLEEDEANYQRDVVGPAIDRINRFR